MKIVFLGTGPSLGVPVPTCKCQTCMSSDSRDKRLRSSLYIEKQDISFVIDCSPDFRQQVLRQEIRHIDFILLTHKHNDHIGGLDDVRPFNYSQGKTMPLYCNEETAIDIKKRFYYSFEKKRYPGAPEYKIIRVQKNTRFQAAGIDIMPIQVLHGQMPVFAYRIGDFTYITDAKHIEDDQKALIKGSKFMVVNVLRPHKKHKMHFNLQEALQLIKEISPEKAFITHMSHNFPPYKYLRELNVPDNVIFAYDGMQVRLS